MPLLVVGFVRMLFLRECTLSGVAGMVARGEVTLIVAAAGSKAGLLDSRAFSAIVAVVLLSTLLTPPMLRFAFARFKQKVMIPIVKSESSNEEKKK